MKKILSLLVMAVACICSTAVFALNPSNVVIDVPTPGTLQAIFPVDQASTVVTLKVNGYLNSTDISYLKSYTPMLANLDMSNVIYGVNATQNNSFQGSSFSGKTSLVRVQMPKHITNINSYAFSDCISLQRIVLPDSLKLIDSYAFQNCTSLDSVVLPAKVYYLGANSFQSCSSLQSISFPKGLTNWYNYTFRYCTNLKSVTLSDTLTSVPYQTFYGCTSLKQVHLPARLTSIAAGAFQNCTSLDTIAFPITLTSIEYSAFQACSSLKSVVLPNNLSNLNYSAFHSCSSLETVIFPPTLTTINDNTFYNCYALKNLTLPNNLLTIGSYAFYNCIALQQLNLPNNVLQSINSYAFQYCRSLESLVIPPSVTTINYYAFSYCSKLKTVKLSNNMSVISEGLFRDCPELDSISYPVGMTSIGHYAFQNCYSLKGQLNLPITLTNIGSQAFFYSGYSTCKSLSVTPPSLYTASNSLGNIKFAFVPESSVAAYKTAWSSILIIGGDTLTSVDVTLTTAGTLGAAIMEKVPYLKDVHKLTVSGPMNTADFNLINQSMPSLISLNLKNALALQIPNNQFQSKLLMLEIVLPDVLESIGNLAFNNCNNLRALVIPDQVTTLTDQQFENCTNLESITLPPSLTSLGSYTFRYCYKLKSIVIPPKVTSINYQDFYECNNLTSVILSDSLTTIASYAFYNCALTSLVIPEKVTSIDDYAFRENNLKSVIFPFGLQSLHAYSFGNCPLDSIILPASLNYLEQNAFYGCTSLKKVSSYQSTPPVLTADPFNGVDVTNIELMVPFWSSNAYKLANIWSRFYPVSTFNTEMMNIPINGNLDLTDNMRFSGSPNVTVKNSGSLTVRGNAPMTNDAFNLDFALYYTKNWWGGGTFTNYFGQLISESPAISANSVSLRMDAYGALWYFLSFPFDVPVGDLTINNESQFVFRKYDGAERANTGTGSSWKTMTQDSVLLAGEGYIYQSSVNALLNMVPTEATKNLIFTSTTRNTSLKEHASSNMADKNWNFVGNPFPSYFDIRFIDFTAPITVWDYYNATYNALSLVDDHYVLKPFEAFFVQKPEDLSQISFLASGRQLSSEVQVNNVGMFAPKLRSAVDRKLINLSINNETSSDKCRVVINPNASLTYELACDASKFMSSQTMVSQLYSLDETGVRYAINERPLGSGVIRLGCYIGEAGTYTLKANNLAADQERILLTDKLLQTQTVLNEQSYSFSATPGTFNSRFELTITRMPTQNLLIDEVSTNVWSTTGKLNVHTKAGNTISIYAVNGILLKEFVSQDEQMEVNMSKGVYLVKVAGKSFKSVVF